MPDASARLLEFLRSWIVLGLLALQSCGTLLNGPPYMVPVDSVPRGATVYYRDAAVGTTPCQVAMDGNCLELVVGGQVVEVDHSRNWVGTIGNVLLLIPGCLVGLAVDFSTGAWRIPDSEGVRVMVASVATPASTPGRIIRSADPNISPYCIVEPCRNKKMPGHTVCQRHLNEAAERGETAEQFRAPVEEATTSAVQSSEPAPATSFCSRPGCRNLHAYGSMLCDTHLAEARAAGTPEEQMRQPNKGR